MPNSIETPHAFTRFVSCREALSRALTRRRFSLRRRRIDSDPHQSPFWIKAVGLLPSGVDTRPLVRDEPQKIVGALPRSKWAAEAGTGAGARTLYSPGAPAPRPRRTTGSQSAGWALGWRRPTPWWLDGRGVSVTDIPPWRCGGDAPVSNQSEWLAANPLCWVAEVSPN